MKPIVQQKLLSSLEVMELLGYKHSGPFYHAVRAHGIPHIRVNARKYLFPEDALQAWMVKRSIGG